MYDGFFAVVTNLEDNPAEIIKINKQRWKIEENFRIMKSDFKARPVYVQRNDRIKAHLVLEQTLRLFCPLLTVKDGIIACASPKIQ